MDQLTNSLYHLRAYGQNRNVYDTVPFWTHFANYFGPNGIADLIQEYGINHKRQIKDTPRSNAALAAFLKKKDGTLLADYYTRFASDAVIQRIACAIDSAAASQRQVFHIGN